MFSRAFVATIMMVVALTTSVMSVPTTAGNSCNSGPVQCCNKNLNGVVGNCSPLSVVGVLPNGSQCNQQTVCCEDNSVSAVVAINCTPINVNA
ncbi:hydrophobin-251 [Armillaria novae-zelandiae]|uniref:Hydrophobin n=1 Tax=Armillaria novae-zelandiae TaxID=153914 RepID=A0AA39NXA9_9AGAR|nr:hydrophobin-251 [Armillaria novae-zelandiae]